MRHWVETWIRAGKELEAVRERELANVNTAEAIRQLFGPGPWRDDAPPRLTSGLVEQQAWFAKLQKDQRI